jgi:hypothetical protein
MRKDLLNGNCLRKHKPDRDLDVDRHHQRGRAASGRIEPRSQAINLCELQVQRQQ